eukprot:scaffold2831_cov249-Ochromonas_danica.AAC.44
MAAFLENIDPKRTAIVFIEFQNDFAAEGGKLHESVRGVMEANHTLENASKVMNEARAKGCKILHAAITFSSDYKEISANPYGILAGVKAGGCFARDTWGADYVEGMKPAPEDLIVLGKSGLCGFESTNLAFLLGQNDIQVVALAGFLTNCCVESTMRAAYERGFKVITLTDCTAASSAAEQEAAVKYTFPMFSVPLTADEFLAKITK